MKYLIKRLNEYKVINMIEKEWINSAMEGNIDLINKYLSNGWDINYQDVMNSTALISACEYGQLFIVKELLKHSDININICDFNGETALIMACIYNYTEIVIELLKQPNIDIYYINRSGKSALNYAIERKNNRIVNLLK